MSRRHLVVVGAGVVLSVGAFWVQEYSLRRYGLSLDVPERLWVQLAAGWAFLGAGVAAKRWRPQSRTGVWMIVFGLVWIGSLVFTAPRIQWHAAGWALAVYGILFIILYSFPTGLLKGVERVAAAVWLGLLTVLSVWVLTTVDFYAMIDDPACCPSHFLFIADNPDLGERLLAVGAILVSLVLITIVVAQVRRWRNATPAGRKSLTVLGLVLAPVIVLVLAIPIVNFSRFGIEGFIIDVSRPGLAPSPFPDRVNLYIQTAMLLLVPVAVLTGLLSSRFSQARVGEMMASLAAPLSVTELEDRLREALGDRTLQLAFPRDRFYMGVDGMPLPDIEETDTMTVLDEEVAIVHDSALAPDLVVSAGTAASLAISNARLQAELRAQLIEVQESRRRLVQATDEARRRVERDLHDGAQQRLVALSAALQRTRGRGVVRDPELDKLLTDAQAEADVAITELRELARGVHPAILTQAGLGPAVTSLVDHAPIPVTVDIDAPRLSADVEATAYFVVAEGLANVFKHAAADEAWVTVDWEPVGLTIEVEDDGSGGIDPSGSGILGLEDRVGALGGRLVVGASSHGGSSLIAVIPLAED